MAGAPVPDRPNIHSNRPQRRLSALKYVCFLGFQDNPDRSFEETAPDAQDRTLRWGASGRGEVRRPVFSNHGKCR